MQDILQIEETFNFKFTDKQKTYNDIILDIFNNKITLKYTYSKEIVHIFGLYYRFCIKDFETMKKCFHSAIMRNSDEAKNSLAEYYYHIKEYYNAIHFLEQIIDKNAQTLLGLAKCHHMSITELNNNFNDQYHYKKMVKYCTNIIELGHMTGANYLGDFYSNKKEYEHSTYYYSLSVRNNNIEGIIKLATYYITVEKNYDEMKKLYQKAIDLGSGIACYYFGEYYKKIDKNFEEMEKYFRKGVELGDIKSTFVLASYYDTHKKNETEMVQMFFRCMKHNYAPATSAFNLFRYYQTNGKIDLSKAILIWSLKFKDPRTYIYLAVYYENIEGNYAKMHKYYLKAFNAPPFKCPIRNIILDVKSIAMLSIAKYYQDIQNYNAAIRCYLYAFNHKQPLASYYLGAIYKDNIKNYELMKKYYDIAINQHLNTQAMNDILTYYIDIEKNPQQMWNYYKQARRLNINFDFKIIYNYTISKLVPAQKQEECIICYQEKDMYFSNCENHPMCMDCSYKLYLTPCPYCRKRPREG